MHSLGRFDELFSGASRVELEGLLRAYIGPRRWFRSKTRTIVATALERVIPLPVEGADIVLTVVRMRYAKGLDEEYVLPLTWVHGDAGDWLARTRPHLVVSTVTVEGEERPRWLVDALGDRRSLEALFVLVAHGATIATEGGSLRFRVLGGGPVATPAEPRPVESEQSNTSVVYGTACVVKIVRKLEEGTAPDLEMGEFLTRAEFAHAPPLLGAIELSRAHGGAEPATIGTAHAYVPNQGDAWTLTVAGLAASWAAADGATDRMRLAASMRPLGERVAQLHAVLAMSSSDPRFAPAPIERAEREGLAADVVASLAGAWALADERSALLPSGAAERLRQRRDRGEAYDECIARFVGARGPCTKTRVHGDLHLGQVLVSGTGFVLIDFEGEPARPLAIRKAKRSPLVDVAGMLRSLQYASVAAARATSPRDHGAQSAGPPGPLGSLAEAWYVAARREFLAGYFAAASASVLPIDPAECAVLLRFYLLEKCVYELHYELNHRPDWVAIPLLGLESLEGPDAD